MDTREVTASGLWRLPAEEGQSPCCFQVKPPACPLLWSCFCTWKISPVGFLLSAPHPGACLPLQRGCTFSGKNTGFIINDSPAAASCPPRGGAQSHAAFWSSLKLCSQWPGSEPVPLQPQGVMCSPQQQSALPPWSGDATASQCSMLAQSTAKRSIPADAHLCLINPC